MTDRFVRSPRALWRRTSDRVIVLVPGTGEIVTLLGTAVDLWTMLVAPVSVEEASASLAQRCGVADAIVANDIRPVLLDLSSRGALARAKP